MTNYNDGKWHGWNGGECPVHMRSIVETVWRFKKGDIRSGKDIGMAGNTAFLGSEYGDLIAFRVVKEYREPRECWAVGKHMHDSLADAEAFRAQVDAANPGRGYLDMPITHWREVVD